MGASIGSMSKLIIFSCVIFFQYDQRPSYMILWKQGYFYESKLLWTYNGLKFNFERFFRLREIRSKVDRNWAINQKASSFVVSNNSDWSKSLMGTVFLRVDPLPSGRRHPGQAVA